MLSRTGSSCPWCRSTAQQSRGNLSEVLLSRPRQLRALRCS
ncbi:unnamed protein product [Ixodes pacificus]